MLSYKRTSRSIYRLSVFEPVTGLSCAYFCRLLALSRICLTAHALMQARFAEKFCASNAFFEICGWGVVSKNCCSNRYNAKCQMAVVKH